MDNHIESVEKVLPNRREKSFTFFVAGSSILIIRFVLYLVHLLFVYAFDLYFGYSEMIAMIISFVLMAPAIVGFVLMGLGLKHLKKEEVLTGTKNRLSIFGQVVSYTAIIWKGTAIIGTIFGIEPIAQSFGYTINLDSVIDSTIFASLLTDVLLLFTITMIISQVTKEKFEGNNIRRIITPFVLIIIIAALIIEIIFLIVLKIRITAVFDIFELNHMVPSIFDLQIAFLIINILYSIISITVFTEFLIKQSK